MKEDFKRLGRCLSGVGVSFKDIKVPKIIEKKVKTIDILLSYGIPYKEAKRYLKVKYIYKRTKNGRIRFKCEKTIYEFNCKYIYSKEDFYNE